MPWQYCDPLVTHQDLIIKHHLNSDFHHDRQWQKRRSPLASRNALSEARHDLILPGTIDWKLETKLVIYRIQICSTCIVVLTKVQHMYVTETLMTIATAKHNQLIFDKIACVITTSNGWSSGGVQLAPSRSWHIWYIQYVHIGQCSCTIATTNNYDLVIPETRCMCTPRRRWYTLSIRLCPRKCIL